MSIDGVTGAGGSAATSTCGGVSITGSGAGAGSGVGSTTGVATSVVVVGV